MDIVLIELDDWAALYIDGKLVEEGHSIDIGYLIKNRLGGKSYWREYSPYDFDGFPETLEEYDKNN